MRIRIITFITIVLSFCCSVVYATTAGQIITKDDPSFVEWKRAGGNMFGHYVELPTIVKDGNSYSCKIAIIHRETRKVDRVIDFTLIELPDNKIKLSKSPNIYDLNSNDLSDRRYKELYNIMKETLAGGGNATSAPLPINENSPQPTNNTYKPVDLMKCWQEDVDASTGEDQKILSTYPHMPEEEFYSNFSNWFRVVDDVTDLGTYYHMERGNKYLKEKLPYYVKNNVGLMVSGITFETNQRLLSRQIFERFRKNLSALYKESSLSNDGTHLLYSTSDLTLSGDLTIFTDYKKDYYRVTWSGMRLTD